MSDEIPPALTRWRPIDGYESHYDVSDDGRVRRTARRDSLGRPRRVGELVLSLTRGYPVVHLCKDNKAKCFRVHRLVARAFLGPCPDGYVVNHKDGAKDNNRVQNLEYVTAQENERHAVTHHLKARGERHGCAKLTEADVRTIRERYAAGDGPTTIGRAFGLHPESIPRIIKRKRWAHV